MTPRGRYVRRLLLAIGGAFVGTVALIVAAQATGVWPLGVVALLGYPPAVFWGAHWAGRVPCPRCRTPLGGGAFDALHAWRSLYVGTCGACGQDLTAGGSRDSS